MTKLEEIELRRATRKAAADTERTEQEVIDLEAIDALEAAGTELQTMTANRFVKGVAVRLAFRPPSGIEYKRYSDLVNRAVAKNDALARRAAQEQLAETCWVYPTDKEARDAVKAAFPGTLISMAIECSKTAELRSAEEGKD